MRCMTSAWVRSTLHKFFKTLFDVGTHLANKESHIDFAERRFCRVVFCLFLRRRSLTNTHVSSRKCLWHTNDGLAGAAAFRSVSRQCCIFASCEMNLILTSRCFHRTLKSQFDVKCCWVFAQRCHLWCLRSLLSEGSVCAAPRTWPNRCSLVRCDVSADVEPLLCRRRLVGPCNPLGLPLLPAAQIRTGTRHKSWPNELDRHTPSRHALLDHPSHNSDPSTPPLSSPFSAPRIIMLRLSTLLRKSRSPRRVRSFVHGNSIAKRVETIIQRIRRMCLHSDNLGFPEMCCCTLCHNVDSCCMNNVSWRVTHSHTDLGLNPRLRSSRRIPANKLSTQCVRPLSQNQFHVAICKLLPTHEHDLSGAQSTNDRIKTSGDRTVHDPT